MRYATTNGVCDTPLPMAYAIRHHEELQGQPGAACLDCYCLWGEAAGATQKKINYLPSTPTYPA
jgi:hypothetical protein